MPHEKERLMISRYWSCAIWTFAASSNNASFDICRNSFDTDALDQQLSSNQQLHSSLCSFSHSSSKRHSLKKEASLIYSFLSWRTNESFCSLRDSRKSQISSAFVTNGLKERESFIDVHRRFKQWKKANNFWSESLIEWLDLRNWTIAPHERKTKALPVNTPVKRYYSKLWNDGEKFPNNPTQECFHTQKIPSTRRVSKKQRILREASLLFHN